MARKKKSSRSSSALAIVSLSIAIAFVGVYLYNSFRPQPVSVNIIDTTTTLQDGPTTLTGTLRKDSPVGVDGLYYLILDSGQPIELDLTDDLDLFLGLSVTVQGDLLTFPVENYLPYLIVTSLATN